MSAARMHTAKRNDVLLRAMVLLHKRLSNKLNAEREMCHC